MGAEETTTQELKTAKVPSTFKALVEGLIFAAQEPLSARQIKDIFEGDPREGSGRSADLDAIRKLVLELNADYKTADRPYRIVEVAGGYQFATLPEYAEWLGKLHREQARRRLSQSGVETLAIIAYKQPITKSEVEKIRGVSCDYVLKALLEKDLVTIVGRSETVGRPLLYGTTKEFLKHFGLNDIMDLPRPREIEEILGESQFETERRMLEAQQGAEEMKKEAEEFKSRLPHIPKKKAELDGQVEIVSRTRSRDIKIVPPSEHAALEEAGQEKIGFAGETPPVADQPQVPQEVAAEQPSPIVEEPAAPPPVDEKIDPGEEKIEPVEVVLPEPEPAVPEPPVAAEESAEHGADKPGLLKSWKQKIQGFIRKLFG